MKYIDSYSWLIPETIKIYNLRDEVAKITYPLTCELEVARDEEFKLVGKLTGTIPNLESINESKDGVPGTFIEGVRLRGTSEHKNDEYVIEGFYITGYEYKYTPDDMIIIDAKAFMTSCKKTSVIYSPQAVTIKDWFITSKNSIFYPRASRKVVETIHRIERDNKIAYEKLVRSSKTSRDYFELDFQGYKILVHKIEKGLRPVWARKLCIEYTDPYFIKNSSLRGLISTIIGYVLGGKLFKIGESEYDIEFYEVSTEYINLSNTHIRKMCSTQAMPPINLENREQWLKVEETINELLLNVIPLSSKMNFIDIIDRYWIGKILPIGTNLPILSSALESMINSYLKAHDLQSTSYMDKAEFHNLVREEIESIEAKLSTNSDSDIIIRKIRNSIFKGSNEKIAHFYSAIGLEIGEIEKKALKARNRMAHSSVTSMNEDQIRETIRLSRAYETLFNRTLLKILGYDKAYIDYFSDGFPVRHLKSAIPKKEK